MLVELRVRRGGNAASSSESLRNFIGPAPRQRRGDQPAVGHAHEDGPPAPAWLGGGDLPLDGGGARPRDEGQGIAPPHVGQQ